MNATQFLAELLADEISCPFDGPNDLTAEFLVSVDCWQEPRNCDQEQMAFCWAKYAEYKAGDAS